MESKNSKVASVIVGVVVALVVGGLIGWAIGRNNMKSVTTNSSATPVAAASSEAAGLRASLVSLGTQHMDLAYAAVASALQGTDSAKADSAALFDNGHQIGAAVGSVYGKDAENAVDKVWDIHLNQFVNYAVASSKGDKAGQDKALATIDSEYTHPLAATLAKANPNLPEKTLYDGLNEHIQMTAAMIRSEAAGDYTKAQSQRNDCIGHIDGLMSTIAEGIAKQYPDKF